MHIITPVICLLKIEEDEGEWADQDELEAEYPLRYLQWLVPATNLYAEFPRQFKVYVNVVKG